MRNFFLSGSFLAIVVLLAAQGCKKEKLPEPDSADAKLYEMSTPVQGATWYKHSDALLNTSAASGHTEDFLRTRFNAAAAAMLDADGKVQQGISFPDGSLIVKELYSNSTTLSTYAVMYKQSTHADADDNGWVWGYFRANGEVRQSVSEKGSGCTGCHSGSGNIDFTLMNREFP